MSDGDILHRIQTDMTAAMKSKDAETLSTLRMLKTALMELKTRKPKDSTLTADEEIEVVQRYAKKRREAIEEFRKLGREDLVAGEEREIQVTARYLPQGLERRRGSRADPRGGHEDRSHGPQGLGEGDRAGHGRST